MVPVACLASARPNRNGEGRRDGSRRGQRPRRDERARSSSTGSSPRPRASSSRRCRSPPTGPSRRTASTRLRSTARSPRRPGNGNPVRLPAGRARRQCRRLEVLAAPAGADRDQDRRGEHEPVDDEDRVGVPANVTEQPQIATSPTTAAASMPTTNGPADPAGSPLAATLAPFRSAAPNTIGTSRRNERRAASSRLSFRKRPAVIVTPEREVPGIRARHWASPTPNALTNPRSSIERPGGTRSAIQRRIANTARRIAICHGLPSFFSMKLSPLRRRARPGLSRSRRTRRSARPQSRSAAARRSATKARIKPAEIAPEVDDDGDQRPEVERYVERLVEVRIGPGGSASQTPTARGSGGPTRRPGATRSRPG